MYVTADPLSPLWIGKTGPLSYSMVQEPELRRVSPHRAMYIPKHPRDWRSHPLLLAAVNLLVYLPRTKGIEIQAMTAGRRFFFLETCTVDSSTSIVRKILNGDLRQVDIQGLLEQSDRPRH